MPSDTDKRVLELEAHFKVITKDADKAIKKYTEDVPKRFKRMQQAMTKAETASTKAVTKLWVTMTQGNKHLKELMSVEEQLEKQLKQTNEALEQEAINIESSNKLIAEATEGLKDLSDAEKAKAEQSIKARQADLANAKARIENAKKEKTEVEKSLRGIQGHIEETKEHFTFKGKGLGQVVKTFADAGQELASPMTKLMSKDIGGFMESGAKVWAGTVPALLGRGMTKVGVGFGKSALESFSKAKKSTGVLATAGHGAMGVAKGGLAVAGGAAGGLLQVIGKLGGAVGAIAGPIVGLVKMFLDAESAAKEFNKGILSASGNGAYLAKGLGTAGMAADKMASDVKNLRDQAFELSNIKWGISKEDHQAVINTLTTEGLTLGTVADQYANAVREGKAFTKVFSNNVQMAVAYSRNMGVSLQEVSSFQAELQTEMGLGVEGVAESFSKLASSAAESGIASNKFFAMIRGVSADLNLYNMRLDDTVGLLTKLGKAMSPKNAQKFMQFAMNALKGMGRWERLKATMLAGQGDVKKIVDKDIKSSTKAVSDQVQKATQASAEQVNAALEKAKKGDRKDINAIIAKAMPEQQGALREAVSTLGAKAKFAKGGLVGLSKAAGMTGPVAQLEIMEKALTKVAGVKTVTEGEGQLGFEAMAENLGVSEEQVRQFAMFRESLEDQKDQALKNARDAGKDSATIAEIEKGNLQAIYDNLDKTAQDQLKNMTDTRTVAEKQADLTQTFMDKLDKFIAFFMNQFYNTVSTMLDTILMLPGVSTAGSKAMQAALKTGNPDLVKALEGASTHEDVRKAVTGTAEYQSMSKTLVGGEASMRDLQAEADAAAATGTPEGIAKAQELESRKAGIKKQLGSAKTAIDTQLGGGEGRIKALMKAAKDTGVGEEELARIEQSLKDQLALGGEGATPTLENAGVQEDRIGMIYQNALANMAGDPGALVKTVGGYGKSNEAAWAKGGTSAATPAVPGAAPTLPVPSAAPPPAGQATPTPATAGSANPAQAVAKTADAVETQVEQGSALLEAQEKQNKLLKTKGIAISGSHWESHIQPVVDKGMLETLRVALLEYYFLSDMKREDVAKALQGGADPKQLGGLLLGGIVDSGDYKPDEVLKNLGSNAQGGLVTGITNGMATVSRIPAGEGMAAVGPGERIVPAGAGGGSQVVEVRFTGELARFVEATASDVQARNIVMSKTR